MKSISYNYFESIIMLYLSVESCEARIVLNSRKFLAFVL